MPEREIKKNSAHINRNKRISKEPFPNTVGARLNAFYFPKSRSFFLGKKVVARTQRMPGRHVINAHESGSHYKKCWFFIMCLRRLTVRITLRTHHLPHRNEKNALLTFMSASGRLCSVAAQASVEVLSDLLNLSTDKRGHCA